MGSHSYGFLRILSFLSQAYCYMAIMKVSGNFFKVFFFIKHIFLGMLRFSHCFCLVFSQFFSVFFFSQFFRTSLSLGFSCFDVKFYFHSKCFKILIPLVHNFWFTLGHPFKILTTFQKVFKILSSKQGKLPSMEKTFR